MKIFREHKKYIPNEHDWKWTKQIQYEIGKAMNKYTRIQRLAKRKKNQPTTENSEGSDSLKDIEMTGTVEIARYTWDPGGNAKLRASKEKKKIKEKLIREDWKIWQDI